MNENELQRTSLYPVLPLRDIVVFPHMIVPLFVGREKSVRALEDVMKDDKQVLLATQKNAAQDDPQTEDIYTVGTIGTVLQLLKLPDGTVKVLIEGGQRARVVKFAENPSFFQGFAEVIADRDHEGKEVEALDELAEREQRIRKTKLSKEAREKALGEMKKLRSMSPMSAEATVVRNYLDWLLGIPWNKPTKVKHDIKAAQKVLNDDHYGLEKVKERILEYLAVQQRMKKVKGPILCLVGPPGVGKTSLGKSVARATGRNFVRMSLGGVRDEAEVRGHRRTYIGSMPGKVIQGMKQAKSSKPLFLLDEVDQLGADGRGDTSSALLEVLDPEQN